MNLSLSAPEDPLYVPAAQEAHVVAPPAAEYLPAKRPDQLSAHPPSTALAPDRTGRGPTQAQGVEGSGWREAPSGLENRRHAAHPAWPYSALVLVYLHTR